MYFHIDALPELASPLRALVARSLEIADREEFSWNVIKVGRREPAVSVLSYPGFWRQAFPLLAASGKINWDTGQLNLTDYRRRRNRPVLHRKELLLPPGHSHIPKFAALTASAEALGLFKAPNKIGLSKGWNAVLAGNHVTIRGHTLRRHAVPDDGSPSSSAGSIDRHKSALSRRQLSQPLQLVQKYGYLDGSYSLFDYGCGKGDDVRLVRELGVEAYGWDPHFSAEQAKVSADVVNLGFVINVIEDRSERDQAVRNSFGLAKRFLVVSALIGNPIYSGNASEHSDGVVTSIGTFQKYYLPDELENYVRSVLNTPVTSVAQGIVLAFRNEEEADRFRAKRAGLRRETPRGSLRRASELYLLDEAARDALSAFWDRCVALGREPLPSELTEIESLEAFGLSTRTAFKFLAERLGLKELQAAARRRSDELLVQFALGHFDGRVYYKYLSVDVQTDISTFFDNFTDLRTRARKLLFSIADTDALLEAALEASSDGLGYMFGGRSLQLHVSVVERLPKILQVYVGCAERLVGGLGRADLVKVHLESGKVSLMAYDDFDGQAVPFLVERIKVNLWTRRIDYFDYIAGYAPPPLLMKSLFLPDDHPRFDEQAEFDGALMKEGLFDVDNPHPTREELLGALRTRQLEIVGYQLRGKTKEH